MHIVYVCHLRPNDFSVQLGTLQVAKRRDCEARLHAFVLLDCWPKQAIKWSVSPVLQPFSAGFWLEVGCSSPSFRPSMHLGCSSGG